MDDFLNEQFETVKQYISQATLQTAKEVSGLINKKGYSSSDSLNEEESRKREREVDQAGVDAMSASLRNAPFCIEIVGSEGKKHMYDYGEKLPTFEGRIGSGRHVVSMVNDVVEGSKSAKLNLPGAVSVVAVSSKNGLMPTPDDISYLDKLFAPPSLKGMVSIDKPIEENLKVVKRVFSVKNNEINVVMMDRDRNKKYLMGAEKFGANVILLKMGDLMPSLLSCLDPQNRKGIYILVGIGGFEEGIMVACAAKALGAVGEGKCWDPDSRVREKFSKTLKIEDMVPGKREDCFLSISAITADKWFNLKAMDTLTVSSEGVKIIRENE